MSHYFFWLLHLHCKFKGKKIATNTVEELLRFIFDLFRRGIAENNLVIARDSAFFAIFAIYAMTEYHTKEYTYKYIINM